MPPRLDKEPPTEPTRPVTGVIAGSVTPRPCEAVTAVLPTVLTAWPTSVTTGVRSPLDEPVVGVGGGVTPPPPTPLPPPPPRLPQVVEVQDVMTTTGPPVAW